MARTWDMMTRGACDMNKQGNDRTAADMQEKDGRNIGALIIRIGLWSILYYTYNKESPK